MAFFGCFFTSNFERIWKSSGGICPVFRLKRLKHVAMILYSTWSGSMAIKMVFLMAYLADRRRPAFDDTKIHVDYGLIQIT